MTRPPHWCILLLLSIAWLLTPVTPTAAQDEAKPPAAEAKPETPAAEPAADTGITLSRLASEAEAVTTRLDAINDALTNMQGVDAVATTLQELTAEISAQRQKLDEQLSGPLSAVDFEPVSATWRRAAGDLEDLVGDLEKRSTRLDGFLEELRGEKTRWEAALESADAEDASDSVRARIEATIASLSETTASIRGRLDQTVNIDASIVEQRSVVRDAREQLEQAQEEARAQVFTREGRPWWDLFSMGSADFAGIRDDLVANAELAQLELVEYVTAHRGRLLLHLAVVVGIGLVMHRARLMLRRRPPVEDEAERHDAIDLLGLSISAPLLIGLCLVFVIHPEGPRAFRVVTVVIAAIPWLRVMGRLLPHLGGLLTALIVLTLVESGRIMLAPGQFLSGPWLIVELAAATGMLAWGWRSRKLKRVSSIAGGRGWYRVALNWIRLAAVITLVGLGGALLAYTNVAATAMAIMLGGTFLGTLFFAGTRILEALLEAVLAAGSLDRLNMVRTQKSRIFRGARVAVRIAALLGWVYMVLSAGGVWTPVRDQAVRLLTADVGYGPVSFSLGGAIAFVLTLFFTWIIARLVSFVLNEEFFPRIRMPQGVPFAITSFVRYGILVVGFLVAIGMLGFSLDRMTLLLSALGVGIGFGLQNVINNFVSGIILLFERPVRVGDRIQLEEMFGDVKSIGIRASVVRTVDGSDVIVPNGEFISSRVINWTLADRKRRIILPAGTAYGSDPRQVIELLLGVAAAHDDVMKHPAPDVLFLGFGESSLDFELRAWTPGFREWRTVRSELAVAVYEALNEAGIEIPFPQRDLHVRSVTPEAGRTLGGSPE